MLLSTSDASNTRSKANGSSNGGDSDNNADPRPSLIQSVSVSPRVFGSSVDPRDTFRGKINGLPPETRSAIIDSRGRTSPHLLLRYQDDPVYWSFDASFCHAAHGYG
jgi:hypothetical protein